jgi:porin
MLTRSTLPYLSSVLLAMSMPAVADDGDAANPSSQETRADDSLWQRDTLIGDLGGRRKDLEKQGLQLAATDIGETLGNLTGGMRRGVTYEGRLELALSADLEALASWTGAAFHVNAYQIHGQGLSASHIGNLLTVSNIEARPSTRLFDLWLQRELVDGKVSFRAGQLAADDEFVVSQYAANLTLVAGEDVLERMAVPLLCARIPRADGVQKSTSVR